MDYKEIMPNRHLYHIPSSKLSSLDCEDCRASYGPSGGGEIQPLLRAVYLGDWWGLMNFKSSLGMLSSSKNDIQKKKIQNLLHSLSSIGSNVSMETALA